jgi:DNA-binding NarL/FixJ family response regulator
MNGGRGLWGVLTTRETEILMVAGTCDLSNKEIAAQLGITEGTVKNHLHTIYTKLGVSSRLSLMLRLRAPDADVA